LEGWDVEMLESWLVEKLECWEGWNLDTDRLYDIPIKKYKILKTFFSM